MIIPPPRAFNWCGGWLGLEEKWGRAAIATVSRKPTGMPASVKPFILTRRRVGLKYLFSVACKCKEAVCNLFVVNEDIIR
jgi:hypothetical protein